MVLSHNIYVKMQFQTCHIFNFEVSKWDYTQLLNTYTCTEDQFQCRDSSLPTVSPTNPTVSPSYGPSATPTRVPSVVPSVVTSLLYFRRINFCDFLSNFRCIIFFLSSPSKAKSVIFFSLRGDKKKFPIKFLILF